MVWKKDIKSVVLEADEITILEREKVKRKIKICDVIGCHSCEKPTGFLSRLFSVPPDIVIRYIFKGPKYKWTAETVEVTGSGEECEALKNRINEKLGQDKERPKKLAVFINPIGGNQDSLNVYSRVISPLFKAANITCDVMVSERPKHMIELISGLDTASVDGLVVVGGDGTLLEILNVLLTNVQKEAGVDYDQPTSKLKPLEVPIGIIPTGTGNGFANGLYGNTDIVTAALHIIKGRTNYNNVQGIYTGGKMASFSAVVIGCGLFSDIIYHTDKQRWLKRARYVVVPLHLLLFKRQRLFNAKVTIFPIKSNTDCQGEKSSDESGSTEEKEGEVFGVASFGGDLVTCISESLDYVQMTQCSRKTDGFSLLIYRETGRFSFLSHFFQMMSLSQSAFERDFLSHYTVKGYKVKLLDHREFADPDCEEAQIAKIIDVDGELMEVVDREYEVWNHMKMAKFYTCY